MIIWEVSRSRSGYIEDNLLRHLKKGVDELEAYTGVGVGRWHLPCVWNFLIWVQKWTKKEGTGMGCMWSPYRWLAFHFTSHKLWIFIQRVWSWGRFSETVVSSSRQRGLQRSQPLQLADPAVNNPRIWIGIFNSSWQCHMICFGCLMSMVDLSCTLRGLGLGFF